MSSEHRPVSQRRRWPVLLAGLLLAGCAAEPESAAPNQERVTGQLVREPATLTTTGARSDSGVVLAGGPAAPYNYGPTAVREGDRFRAWWCSQLPGVGPSGDDVLHASSDSLDVPFRSAGGAPAAPVFHGAPGAFDAMHTCDPSVLRVDGTYHLYYTGAAGDHADGNTIGHAGSPDGLAWRRAAGGDPIVRESGERRRANAYGAGQPSAVFLDGWFYLMFTDTTAAGAGHNGAGQFVLRARDAAFTSGVERLTAHGFEPTESTSDGRPRSVVDAFSADWMWVDALQAFAIAHQVADGTAITFWDRDFTHHPYERLLLPGEWREGPGLVRGTDGHAPVSASDPCGTVPIDVLRATRLSEAPTDIVHTGLDVRVRDGCQDTPRAAGVLDGFGVPSPSRTVDLVANGGRVRVERRSVAERMSRAVLEEPVPALNELPMVGSIVPRARGLRAPTGEVGLLDDRKSLWLVDPAAAEANDSIIEDVDEATWQHYRRAGDLRKR